MIFYTHLPLCHQFFYFYLSESFDPFWPLPCPDCQRLLWSQKGRLVYCPDSKTHKFLKAISGNPKIYLAILSVQRWLERTPGLNEEGFNFPQKFKEAVEAIFDKEWQRVQVIFKKCQYNSLFLSKKSICCSLKINKVIQRGCWSYIWQRRQRVQVISLLTIVVGFFCFFFLRFQTLYIAKIL